jgi:ABC-type nitrate/sulfonate/bicarbonate transport system permease component
MFVDFFLSSLAVYVILLGLLEILFTPSDTWIAVALASASVIGISVVMWVNHSRTKNSPLYPIVSALCGMSVMLTGISLGIAWSQHQEATYQWIYILLAIIAVGTSGFVGYLHSDRGFLPDTNKYE